MLAIERVPYLGERSKATWLEPDRWMIKLGKRPMASPMAVFDCGGDLFRRLYFAMGEKSTL